MKNIKFVVKIVLILTLAIILSACEPEPSSAPENATLVVVNDSSSDMYYLYVSPSSSSSWGDNQLTSTLNSGSTFTLNEIPPGEYDMYADSSASLWGPIYNIALNEGATWTWTLID